MCRPPSKEGSITRLGSRFGSTPPQLISSAFAWSAEKTCRVAGGQKLRISATPRRGDFRALIAEEPAIKNHLSAERPAECFGYARHLQGVERAYERLGV